VFPTPVVGVVGILPTAAPAPLWFQRPGRTVLLLGGLGECDAIRFGGTQYAEVVLNELWGLPPALDLDYEKRVQAAIREIARAGLAESSHDLSDGGLAVALAEASLGGVGARIALDSSMPPELVLFHEGPSRILVSTSRPGELREAAARHGVPALEIGETSEGRLEIRNRGAELGSWSLAELHSAYEGALERHV
jgi:phosphoribosylformylglycinamidine synthase